MNNDYDNKIDKIVLIYAILFWLFYSLYPALSALISGVLSVTNFGSNLNAESSQFQRISTLSQVLAMIPFSLVSALWLKYNATIENKNKFLWFLFGLVFNYWAIFFYYISLIHEKLINGNYDSEKKLLSKLRS